MTTYAIRLPVWVQTSSDYHAVERSAILLVDDDTTIAEVMEWAKAQHCQQQGDPVITVPQRIKP